jgi:hypothetical protein
MGRVPCIWNHSVLPVNREFEKSMSAQSQKSSGRGNQIAKELGKCIVNNNQSVLNMSWSLSHHKMGYRPWAEQQPFPYSIFLWKGLGEHSFSNVRTEVQHPTASSGSSKLAENLPFGVVVESLQSTDHKPTSDLPSSGNGFFHIQVSQNLCHKLLLVIPHP